MTAILISMFVGIAGILITRASLRRLAAGSVPRDAHVYWGLGLAGVLPAWLVVFVTLLGDSPTERPELGSAVAWILSAAAGLLGAITSEALVRQSSESPEGLPPARGWRVGLWGGVPAWVIAVLGHVFPRVF